MGLRVRLRSYHYEFMNSNGSMTWHDMLLGWSMPYTWRCIAWMTMFWRDMTNCLFGVHRCCVEQSTPISPATRGIGIALHIDIVYILVLRCCRLTRSMREASHNVTTATINFWAVCRRRWKDCTPLICTLRCARTQRLGWSISASLSRLRENGEDDRLWSSTGYVQGGLGVGYLSSVYDRLEC